MLNLKSEKDQHLLIDKEILKKEIEAAQLSKEDKILEIGAGTGTLTKELARKASRVTAFEIDKQFSEDLGKLKKENKNLKIIYGNALNFSWKGYNKIVSNIPYTLSEPIILKAIRENMPLLVLIVSEGFKENLMNKDSKIGFITQLFYNMAIFDRVDRKCFSPSPKTDSYIIKLEKRDEKNLNESEKALRFILFKEGKLKNAFLSYFLSKGKTKNQAREILKQLKIPEKTLEKKISKITGKSLNIINDFLRSIL